MSAGYFGDGELPAGLEHGVQVAPLQELHHDVGRGRAVLGGSPLGKRARDPRSAFSSAE